ncbi:sulfatase-like hydrolase/transferase [Paludisphaera rhizosphaerae]|uniref:sulfatase-like hydrolase/transferase n=1 Tax=Paludisphaera rhizosphaerae TaxID=2711216 RepID=UPI0013ED7497|nr:sulfatase-like hydrolase/transferase [Paludisphaera rhizosphaerae]
MQAATWKRIAVATLLAALAATTQAASPNVVVILVDDLGYADLGCQGSKSVVTPHIDTLAADGVRFTAGYVTAPQCSPSRAGLMTGAYQQRFGHEANPEVSLLRTFGLAEGRSTLADRLKAAGYRTIGVGKWDLGAIPSAQPWARGFDEYLGFYTGSRSYRPIKDETPSSYSRLRSGPDRLVGESGWMTDVLSDAAVDAINRHADAPFFLYLAYNAPHWPMEAPLERQQRFRDVPDLHRRMFLAMMSQLDDGVGRVLNVLRTKGLDERTLVFFLSDNGGPTGPPRPAPDARFVLGINTSLNTPFRGQKGALFEGGVRIPFLVRWTGTIPGGRTYDRPVSSLDILPTALAAAGAAFPDDGSLDGVNLLPYLAGAQTGDPHEILFWRWMGQLAVRRGDWKLIRRTPEGPFELFNPAADPGETRNLAVAHPEVVRDLRERLRTWNAGLAEPLWRTPAQDANLRRAYDPQNWPAP